MSENNVGTIAKEVNSLRNYDEFLVHRDSPVDRGVNVSSLDFDNIYERDVIRSSHIKDFTFNAGTGGTLTLGGTENGNGFLIVRNAAGGTICTIDNTGITVTTGSITINNSAGSTIIDQYGLKSSTSFIPVYESMADGTIVGTTPYTVGTIGTLSLARNTSIMFTLRGYLADKEVVTTTVNSVNQGISTVWISLDTPDFSYVIIGGSGMRNWTDGGTALNTYTEQVTDTSIFIVPAGTYSVNIYAANSETGTALWWNVYGGYSNFGV
jgi:hypothetical protein